MRWSLPVLLLFLLAGLAHPVLAAEENRIGYVSFEQVRIQLTDGNARVEVDYTLDPGMHFIILLFGAGDLQKKVERAVGYPSPKAEEVGLSHAVFLVENAAEDYGDRAYWFPGHSFGVTFPQVKLRAPGYSLSFSTTRTLTKGFGYFGALT